MRQHEQALTTDERLSVLETDVRGVREVLASVNTKIDQMNRPRWDTWAAWLIVLFSVIAGGSWIIRDRFEYIEREAKSDNAQVTERANLNRDLIHELQTAQAVHTAKLVEVETQFKASSNIANLQHAGNRVLIDQLWQAQFGKRLQENVPYPVVGNGVTQ